MSSRMISEGEQKSIAQALTEKSEADTVAETEKKAAGGCVPASVKPSRMLFVIQAGSTLVGAPHEPMASGCTLTCISAIWGHLLVK